MLLQAASLGLFLLFLPVVVLIFWQREVLSTSITSCVMSHPGSFLVRNGSGQGETDLVTDVTTKASAHGNIPGGVFFQHIRIATSSLQS